MSRPKIGLTAPLPHPTIEILDKYCETETYTKDELLEKGLLKLVTGKDGLICTVADKITSEVMDIEPNLKVISSYSVGFDHVDLTEATKRGIYVTNTPGVLTETTADLTWALLMSTARRITESDRYIREGRWNVAWAPDMMVGEDIHGRTLGIVGLGRIGSAIAKRASGFNMKVLYHDVIRLSQEVEKELSLEYTSLENILEESDYITLHVALNEHTHHLINEEKLKKMKSTAYLINASRGPVIDQKALAKALKEGWIAGAAIDVYEKEPIAVDDPLLQLDNIVLVPHIGSASRAARSKMGEVAAKNLVSILKGEQPVSLVNNDVLNVRPLSEMKIIS